jgi:DHA1 family multidrug resistance protein-like MFS transporter
MEQWRKTLWILMVCVFLTSMSYTLVIPFLPIYLLELGVSDEWVNLWAGIVFSASFLVGAIAAPLWGSLADKYGKRKMVIRASLGLSISYVLFSLVSSPWELLACRILQGITGGFVPAAMTIAAATSPTQRLSMNLGMMQSATALGGIVGPLFGGIFAEWLGIRSAFIVSSACLLITTFAAWRWVKEPEMVSTSAKVASRIRDDLYAVMRHPILPKLLLLFLLFQLSYNTVQPFFTLYVVELRGSLDGAMISSGIILALAALAMIIASPRWGQAGHKVGYPIILAICFSCSGIFLGLQFFSHQLWQFGLLHFLFGLVMAGIIPSLQTLVVQNTNDDFRGRAFGLITSANQLGAMLGPLIGGILALQFAISQVFLITGTLLGIISAAVMLQSRTSKNN